jgi:hypothetical protein
MESIESRFEAEMVNIYERAKRECNYNATRFLQMMTELGALGTAKALLHAPGLSDGFTALWECGCPGLTMEALVLRSPWCSLFTEEELAVACKRLTDIGYKVDDDLSRPSIARQEEESQGSHISEGPTATASQSSHAEEPHEVSVGNPQDAVWLGRKWAAWASLREALMRGTGPPHQAGLYRLRDSRSSGLLYIGQGGDVRGRLFQLRNAMKKVAAGGKQGPPHWAGACVLHQERQGADVEVSWLLEPVLNEGERKGLECEYIAAHRWATGHNPACQFTALARREPR